MEYHALGATGMNVSRFGLGAAALGGVYGETDEDELCKVVRDALDLGINFIDTSPWYGNGRSEEVLGKALKYIPRDRYYMATKVGRYEQDISRMFNFSAEKTLESVDQSLQLMGLDYVDLIQVHDLEFAPNIDIILNQTLPALQKVKDSGKAHFIGITGYPIEKLREVVEKSTIKIDTVLSYCHLSMNNSSLLDHLDFFKDRNISVINASPLSMGLLTHQGPCEWHPAPKYVKEACFKAAQFCEKNGVNLPRLALDYTFSFAEIPITLTSVDKVKILKDNVEVLHEGLTKEEEQMKHEVMNRFMLPLKNADWGRQSVERYWQDMDALKQRKC